MVCLLYLNSLCFRTIHRVLERLVLLAVFSASIRKMVPAVSSPLWNLRCWYSSETSPLAPQLLCTWKIFSFHLKESIRNEKKSNFICKETPRELFLERKQSFVDDSVWRFPFNPLLRDTAKSLLPLEQLETAEERLLSNMSLRMGCANIVLP